MFPKIHIGMSGWSYPEWKSIFYPAGTRPTEWLSFYASEFDSVEINMSFYHLPKIQTVANWVSGVPGHFRFCPKISRYLTHIKKLQEPEEPLERFFDVFEPMYQQCGPVLLQLPPSLRFDYETAAYLFALLGEKYKQYEFALEVRHASWLDDTAFDLMAQHNIAFVISQSGVGFPYSEMVTARNIYIRFHGPGKLYASSYTDEMLAEYAHKFKGWIKEGHIIWTFFNNTMYGAALENGRKLRQLMKER